MLSEAQLEKEVKMLPAVDRLKFTFLQFGHAYIDNWNNITGGNTGLAKFLGILVAVIVWLLPGALFVLTA